MHLGILVNTDRHLKHVLGLATAAAGQGHEVTVFLMDAGTRLLEDARLPELAARPGVTVSLCAHSAERCGVHVEALSDEVVRGSQLHNALMNHQADRIVVL